MRLAPTLVLLLLTSACALPRGQRPAPRGMSGVGVVVGATTSRCTVVVLEGEATRICLPPKRKPKEPKEPQDSTRADTVSRVTVAARK